MYLSVLHCFLFTALFHVCTWFARKMGNRRCNRRKKTKRKGIMYLSVVGQNNAYCELPCDTDPADDTRWGSRWHRRCNKIRTQPSTFCWFLCLVFLIQCVMFAVTLLKYKLAIEISSMVLFAFLMLIFPVKHLEWFFNFFYFYLFIYLSYIY